MPKVVFVAANETHGWGGSEYCWSAAAERLAQQGVKVVASVKRWDRPAKQVEHLHSVGCEVAYRPQLTLGERIRRRIFLPKGFEQHHLRGIASDADLIVISQGGNTDGLAWMEASLACGFRYVTIVQSVSEHWWPRDDLAERFASAYEGARCAFFVSHANLELSRRQFVTGLSKAKVIRNPFSVRYDARPKWPADSDGQLRLACVGRLEVEQKGQDLLLQLLALPHWRARNVCLTLAGKGDNERSLKRTAEMQKLDNIRFAGFVEDIEKLWSEHHALVLPSRYEGMPLALVEAMLCGRPGIVTDVAGHRELARDGINGFIAKAPTVELLDEAMNRAWESRAQLQQIGKTAAADVRQWVSPDPTGEFVSVLDSLVNGPSS